MKTLKWTWESCYSKIKIFDGPTLVGNIPGFGKWEVGIINGKKFSFERSWSRIYICDPDDRNKAYCEITGDREYSRFSSPDFEYATGESSFWPFKRKLYLTDNALRKVEIEIPGGFFVNSGLIHVYNEKNYELAIYGLLLLNTFSNSAT